MHRSLFALFACLAAGFSGTALADGYGPLPLLDGQQSPLQMQIVGYRGGTNGEMAVKVRNPTSRSQVFSAKGLYFVPEGDPERAPQRLGAAGPFVVLDDGEWRPKTEISLAPRREAELRLQVFCIDSHRSSPSTGNVFKLGSTRMPKKLAHEIEFKANGAIRRAKGDHNAAKGAIQSEVWGARDKDWIKLEGERQNEKSPRQQRHIYERRYRLQQQQPVPQEEVQRIGPR